MTWSSSIGIRMWPLCNWSIKSEITHLLRKGKFHCMVDLLFDWLGFGQTSKSVFSFNSTKQLNPNQSNRRSAVQWYFPLQSKWVFSDHSECECNLRPVWPDWSILYFLVTNFQAKLVQMFGNFNKTLLIKQLPLFGNVWINWATFYFKIWSHCLTP